MGRMVLFPRCRPIQRTRLRPLRKTSRPVAFGQCPPLARRVLHARPLLWYDRACHRLLVRFCAFVDALPVHLRVCNRYFSVVFAATKTFPRFIGIASGTSLSIFGLSPLFLSLLASRFTPPGQTLDIPSFFTFMATVTGIIHLTSTVILRANRPLERRAADAAAAPSTDAESSISTEQEPLLGSAEVEDEDEYDSTPKPKDPVSVHIVPVQEPQEGSTLDLFKDPSFWVLSLWLVLVVGAVCTPFLLSLITCHAQRLTRPTLTPAGRDGRLQSRLDRPLAPARIELGLIHDRERRAASPPTLLLQHALAPARRPARGRARARRVAPRQRRLGVRPQASGEPRRVHARNFCRPRSDLRVPPARRAQPGGDLASQVSRTPSTLARPWPCVVTLRARVY